MKSILVCFLTFVVTGFGVSTSFAGTYISGNLGAVIVNDSDIDDGPFSGEVTFDTGYGFLAAFGSSNQHSRVELEVGYRKNDFDEIKIDGLGKFDIDGDVSSYSLMGNIYYDFSKEGGFYPFIGVGIGAAYVELDSDDAGSEDDTELAYQVILGGSFTSSVGLSIDLQYRYFATDDLDFDGSEAEYGTHNLMLGLRQSF
jgi:opacity protein-like surface antigen